MSKWNRDLLDKYCRQYNVGIIGFILKNENTDNHKSDLRKRDSSQRKRLDNFPIFVHFNNEIKDYQLNPYSDIFRIARPGSISLGSVPENNWTIFILPQNSTSFLSIAQALPRNYTVVTYPNGYKYSNIENKSHNENYQKNLLTTVFQVCILLIIYLHII